MMQKVSGHAIREIVKELENPDIQDIDANSIDGTHQIATRLRAKVITHE